MFATIYQHLYIYIYRERERVILRGMLLDRLRLINEILFGSFCILSINIAYTNIINYTRCLLLAV